MKARKILKEKFEKLLFFKKSVRPRFSFLIGLNDFGQWYWQVMDGVRPISGGAGYDDWRDAQDDAIDELRFMQDGRYGSLI